MNLVPSEVAADMAQEVIVSVEISCSQLKRAVRGGDLDGLLTPDQRLKRSVGDVRRGCRVVSCPEEEGTPARECMEAARLKVQLYACAGCTESSESRPDPAKPRFPISSRRHCCALVTTAGRHSVAHAGQITPASLTPLSHLLKGKGLGQNGSDFRSPLF